MDQHQLPDLREVVDCAAVCAVAYNSWEESQEGECEVERSLRQPRALARPVVEHIFRRFEVKERRRFPSGLDAKVFSDTEHKRILVAADGTDLTGRCRTELRGDLLNCLALVLGRRSAQVDDLLHLLQEIRASYPDRSVVGVGHSLGGYVQQVAAARRPELVDRTLAFNAPGVWRFSADLQGSNRGRLGRIFSFSAIEPVAFVGRPLGRRAWLHGLYSHRITDTYGFLEGRWREGYALANKGARIRLGLNTAPSEGRELLP